MSITTILAVVCGLIGAACLLLMVGMARVAARSDEWADECCDERKWRTR